MGRRRNEGPSPREREVLYLVSIGMSNQQIADALVLSVYTVQGHVSNIYQKLGLTGRAQAIRWAIDHDIEGSKNG
jgi:DNA-binding NarL/FixJ family response regulator